MSRLYACIISPDAARDENALVTVAAEFAHAIEVIADGVLFDASGLERLMGKPERIAGKVLAEMEKHGLAGSVAVADTVDTAMLLARNDAKGAVDISDVSDKASLVQPEMFPQIPLSGLSIERDTLNVFSELGLHSVRDLLAVPQDDLISRYGREFREVIDVLEQRGKSLVTPNVRENRVSWSFDLDKPVEDFEQLIFLLNHGLERLFAEVQYHGASTEHLDVALKLRKSTHSASDAAAKSYEIKTSFPTLERAFWLKLIDLRCSLDPPEALIIRVDVTAHFTKARPDQRGLYAVSRPEPESLLLTVGKLKKLVGDENVGVPVLLDQRLSRPFTLDATCRPSSASSSAANDPLASSHCGRSAARAASIVFNYFRPPLRAEVLARDGRLVFVRTRAFSGHVVNYSGVWKGSSQWWDKPWRTQEWDVEIENGGVYRLAKTHSEWFLTGEYD